jgi:single-strand DNA-binding protein
MTEASVSFAGNLTDDPELRHTDGGIARAMFRVAVSGRREQEASFFTVIVWRDQAEHAAKSLCKGSRVVVLGRLQQRPWTAEDGSARQVVEVVANELGPSLRWATATTTRTTRSAETTRCLGRSCRSTAWLGPAEQVGCQPPGSLTAGRRPHRRHAPAVAAWGYGRCPTRSTLVRQRTDRSRRGDRTHDRP